MNNGVKWRWFIVPEKSWTNSLHIIIILFVSNHGDPWHDNRLTTDSLCAIRLPGDVWWPSWRFVSFHLVSPCHLVPSGRQVTSGDHHYPLSPFGLVSYSSSSCRGIFFYALGLNISFFWLFDLNYVSQVNEFIPSDFYSPIMLLFTPAAVSMR